MDDGKSIISHEDKGFRCIGNDEGFGVVDDNGYSGMDHDEGFGGIDDSGFKGMDNEGTSQTSHCEQRVCTIDLA